MLVLSSTPRGGITMGWVKFRSWRRKRRKTEILKEHNLLHNINLFELNFTLAPCGNGGVCIDRCKAAPGTRPYWEYWWSFHCCPLEQWRRTTCGETDNTCHANETQDGSTYVFKPHILTVHLHIHLGVVDEVLQWVSTWVVILELCIVGDCPDGGVEGSYHPTDVHRLDVGEVGEYSRPWCTCGLRNYWRETWLFKNRLKMNGRQCV